MGVEPEPDRSDRLRRLRWRRQGAWQWPVFAIVTVAEAILLHELPLAGDGTGYVPGFLLAGCLNLLAIAALGGAGGWLIRRRRRDLPQVVAQDYAGLALMAAIAITFVTIGIVHHGEREEDDRQFARQSQAVRDYVATQGDAFAEAHLDVADSITLGEDRYRTCVPTEEPRRFDCFIVRTDFEPPRVIPDDSRAPNSTFLAP